MEKKELKEQYGEVLSTDEMLGKYEVIGFSMGVCIVRRRQDNQRGYLDFQHSPRFYYDFTEA